MFSYKYTSNAVCDLFKGYCDETTLDKRKYLVKIAGQVVEKFIDNFNSKVKESCYTIDAWTVDILFKENREPLGIKIIITGISYRKTGKSLPKKSFSETQMGFMVNLERAIKESFALPQGAKTVLEIHEDLL